MKRLVLPFLILLIIAGAGFLWYKEGTLPVDKADSKSVIFVISPGESVSAIARKLESEKLIRNRIVFYLLVKAKGIEKKIQAGDFRLSRNLSAAKLAEELTHGTLDVWVTVIEGMRSEEIAAVLSKQLEIPETVFLSYAKDYEGYLFPDTYLMPRGANSQTVVSILKANFEQKVTSEIKKQILAQDLTFNEGVILASLLEREAKSYEDKRMVAGILLNRLAIDMPLQVDASVQYVMGYSNKEHTWWRKNLTNADLNYDSPFNTYKYPGLPPQPIANPGLNALQAVANAKKSDYLFYITDHQGIMHYAATLEEHNRNISRYLD